ncbi:cytotoxic necrotizing factor Rho-activating domain-containing protein [Paraburkholderia fungorum]|uniref:cytotoxic necrotizing factor Rho-activating domain-containing protein n=1 Tax=Paraburkholderia fungorum TaxID=134537 RepID=UPI0038BDB26A
MKTRAGGLSAHPNHPDSAEDLSRVAAQRLVQTGSHNQDYHMWIYISWMKMEWLHEFITSSFDNGLFEKSMTDLWLGKTSTDLTHEAATYSGAVKAAFSDYHADKNSTDAKRLSSEDRYGAELYQLSLSNSTGSPGSSPNAYSVIPILIKIKAYETCRYRDVFGQPAKGSISSAVKLESLFSLPATSIEDHASEDELRKYLQSKLWPDVSFGINENCRKGCATAFDIYKDSLKNEPATQDGSLNSDNIFTSLTYTRNIIDSTANECQNFLYNYRGPTYRSACDQKRTTLLQCRYAAMYLSILEKRSQEYLDILNELKPRLPRASGANTDIQLLDSRALAVREALQKFSAEKSRPNFEQLSTRQFLKNYPALIASNEEVFYFISFAEAIFLMAKTGTTLQQLYREAADPPQVIRHFNSLMQHLPFSRAAHRRGIEGLSYLQNVESNTKTKSDTEYYNQFSTFKNKYFSDVAKLIAIDKLTQLGVHPYDMVASRPIRCARMELTLNKLSFWKPEMSVTPEIINRWTYAGDLVFCQLETNDWLIISTIGRQLFLNKISDSTMCSNAAFNKIRLQSTPPPIVSREDYSRDNREWYGDLLNSLVLIPVFGTQFPLDKTTYAIARLRFSTKESLIKRTDGTSAALFQVVQQVAESLVKSVADQSEAALYHRRWWQYFTPMIPGFDIAYRRYHDVEYAPSYGEITWEVINAGMAIAFFGVPVGKVLSAESSLLRSTILLNAHQGYRGLALVTRVIEQAGSELALASLRTSAMTVSYFISPWEPVPLELIGPALYRQIRRLMKGKLIFKLRPADAVIGKPDGAPSSDAKPNNAKPLGNRRPKTKPLPQIFRTESAGDIRVYEFSYNEASETLLGADNEPQPGPSGAAPQNSDTNGFMWEGNVRALENRGAISLETARHITKIDTPFQFARNDNQFLSLDPVPSTHPTLQSGLELFQLGLIDDVVFSRFGEKVSFISGSSVSNKDVEVVMIPAAEAGAIGIRINFEDVDEGRPILVSPGALSDSIFVMGISKQENSVFFYHVSKPSLESVDSARRDPTIERLLEVHNSLIGSPSGRMAIPEDVAMSDIQLLARLFDYSNILYSDPTGATGFHVVAPGSAISQASALKNLSRHAVSAENLWIFNYGLLDSHTRFSKLEGRTHYLLTRTSDDQLKITGRSEIAGIFDGKLEEKILDAVIEKESESDCREIVELLAQKGSYNKFVRSPEEFEINDLPGLAGIFSEEKYTTNFRLTKIWSSADPGGAQFHFLLVVEKDESKYSVDISASRFLNLDVKTLIVESDRNWQQTYQKHLGDKLCLFRDFPAFNLFEDYFKAGLGSTTPYDDVSDASWTVVNRPSWMLSRANHMLVDAIDTDQTVVISSAVGGPSATVPANTKPEATNARWLDERWLNIIQDEKFNTAIAGAGDIKSMEVIEEIAKSYAFRTEVYLTLTYLRITDSLPTANLALAVRDHKRIVSIIDPAARREGKDTALFTWDEWLDHRSKGILLRRKYSSAALAQELFTSSAENHAFGSADFFDESTRPYEVLSFDSSYLRELDILIGHVEAEMQGIGFDDPGLDFGLESEKLERLRTTVGKNDSDAILPMRAELTAQEQTVRDLSEHVALRGLLGRLTDLKGQVSSLHSERRVCRGLVYDCNSMVGDKVDLAARMAISYPFIQERLKIRVYDFDKRRYASSSQFELVLLGNTEYLIKIEDVQVILKQYQSLYREMADLAAAYANSGGGSRAFDIAENARAGSTVVDELLQYYLSPATRIFGIVDKAEKGRPAATVFGVSAIRDEPTAETTYTVAVTGIIAHPFSQIRNDEKFISYVLRHRHSPAWSVADLKKYNLEGIGRFLSYHTIKHAALRMSGVQKIVALAINPRSEIIAASFGMKRVDELAKYRALFSRATYYNLRSLANNAVRRAAVRTPGISSSGPASGADNPSATENVEFQQILSGHIAGAMGKGAVYLRPDRTVRSFPWNFVFARSDSQIAHESPQPSAALDTSAPYNIRLGQGSDIVSYPQATRVSYGDFWSGKNTGLQNLDVIQIPNGDDGAKETLNKAASCNAVRTMRILS